MGKSEARYGQIPSIGAVARFTNISCSVRPFSQSRVVQSIGTGDVLIVVFAAEADLLTFIEGPPLTGFQIPVDVITIVCGQPVIFPTPGVVVNSSLDHSRVLVIIPILGDVHIHFRIWSQLPFRLLIEATAISLEIRQVVIPLSFPPIVRDIPTFNKDVVDGGAIDGAGDGERPLDTTGERSGSQTLGDL